MKKTIIYIIFTTLFFSNYIYAKESLLSFTKEEHQYLKNKQDLTVCVKPDWLPYESIEDGEFVGISADFLKLISNKLSIPLKIIHTKNQLQSIQVLLKKECDLKPLMGKQKITGIPYKHTSSYFEDTIALVTRIEQPFVTELNDIEESIVIAKGFKGIIKFIKKSYPKIKIIKVDTIEKGLELVANGKSFGYIGTSLNSSYRIQKNYSTKLKIANDFKKLEFGIGVKDDDKLLLNILNKVVLQTTKQEKDEILNKWVKTTVEKEHDHTFAINIILLILFVLAIVVYFLIKQNRLKKELEELNSSLEQRVKLEVEKNRQKDQHILQHSKLAQMGEMISMIAHQWRQPLTAISATTNNLSFKLMMDDIDKKEFETEIKLISDYSQHLSTTIDDFRNFFKSNKVKEITTLENIVNDTLKIIKTSIENKNIKIELNLTCNIEFHTYPNEIKQVLLNLIKNAEDVLIDRTIKDPIITIETICIKDEMFIVVKDNAKGIKQDIIEKIFDPYFSTKKAKDGTGLGLYMSKIIIEEHCKGNLSVSNNKYGAIFTIKLIDIK